MPVIDLANPDRACAGISQSITRGKVKEHFRYVDNYGDLLFFEHAKIADTYVKDIVPDRFSVNAFTKTRWIPRPTNPTDFVNWYVSKFDLEPPNSVMGFYAHAYGEQLKSGVLFSVRPIDVNDPEMVGVMLMRDIRQYEVTFLLHDLMRLSFVVSNQSYIVESIERRLKDYNVKSSSYANGWATAVKYANKIAEEEGGYVKLFVTPPPWADEMDIQPKTKEK